MYISVRPEPSLVFYNDTFRRADKQMYVRKEALKKEMGIVDRR